MDHICPICQNQYSSNNIPLLLDCNHLSCITCLYMLKNKGIQAYSCQVCKTKIWKEIGQLQAQLQLIKGENQQCLNHKKQYEFYCSCHKQKICSLCFLQTHKNCDNILAIEEYNQMQSQQKQLKEQDLHQDNKNLVQKLQKLEMLQSQFQQQYQQQKVVFQEAAQTLMKYIISRVKEMFKVYQEKYQKGSDLISTYKQEIQGIVCEIEEVKKLEIEEMDEKIQQVKNRILNYNSIESEVSQYELQQFQKQEILQNIIQNLTLNEIDKQEQKQESRQMRKVQIE